MWYQETMIETIHFTMLYMPGTSIMLYPLLYTNNCSIGHPPETHLKLKSREISPSMSTTSICLVRSFWNFAQSTAVILPCSVQNFKRLDNWNEHYWRTRFREIWLQYEFRVDILYRNSPLYTIVYAVYMMRYTSKVVPAQSCLSYSLMTHNTCPTITKP